jgi:hypothetical protein
MKQVITLLLVIGIVAIAAGSCPAIERNAVVVGSRVQIHESAAGDSPTVGLLGEGVAVAILGRKPTPDRVEGFTDYWYRINYRGKTGWVFGQFISPSTGGRGLARIYTAAELADYADHAVMNLVAIRKAGYYAALIDASGRLSADITELSEDPILCLMAEGYAGTGDTKGAEKIVEKLRAYNPATPLPDKITLGAAIDRVNGTMLKKDTTAP